MPRRTLRLALPLAAIVLATALVTAQRGARPSAGVPANSIFQAIGVAEGLVVCEIGAGNGELSIEAARRVGERGRIYTSELGDQRVRALEKAAQASGLSQITVVTGEPNETAFPDEACDALFMRNVYHHFANPAAMNTSIVRALKPGARVAVVDFSPSRGREAERPADRGISTTHGVGSETVRRELRDAGLEIVATEAGDDRWFMVVAAKPRG